MRTNPNPARLYGGNRHPQTQTANAGSDREHQHSMMARSSVIMSMYSSVHSSGSPSLTVPAGQYSYGFMSTWRALRRILEERKKLEFDVHGIATYGGFPVHRLLGSREVPEPEGMTLKAGKLILSGSYAPTQITS